MVFEYEDGQNSKQSRLFFVLIDVSIDVYKNYKDGNY